MNAMTESQREACHQIIHGAAASAAAIGAGLAQLPCADTVIITPIQIGMIESLGNVFGINLGEATAKAILAGALASIGGRSLTQVLVGWIPGIGNIVNATTAAGITEAIGWIAVEDFDRYYSD
jgi:uncharacterized protein (DUF697 family)